jgi:metal-responsive CopG/Arc/MetJ family transcriptional regulator
MLRNIQKEWAGLNENKRNGLLKYVYQTQPMIDAKAHHKPEEKAPLNLYLEHEKVIEELGV